MTQAYHRPSRQGSLTADKEVPMPIGREEVRRIAVLARLELLPEEEERLVGELAGIVAYIDKLDELDTSDVEPLAFGASGIDVFREDGPRPSFPSGDMLSNAPDTKGTFYRVPQVVE